MLPMIPCFLPLFVLNVFYSSSMTQILHFCSQSLQVFPSLCQFTEGSRLFLHIFFLKRQAKYRRLIHYSTIFPSFYTEKNRELFHSENSSFPVASFLCFLLLIRVSGQNLKELVSPPLPLPFLLESSFFP